MPTYQVEWTGKATIRTTVEADDPDEARSEAADEIASIHSVLESERAGDWTVEFVDGRDEDTYEIALDPDAQ